VYCRSCQCSYRCKRTGIGRTWKQRLAAAGSDQEKWDILLSLHGLGEAAGKTRTLRDAAWGLDSSSAWATLMRGHQSGEGQIEIEALVGLYGEGEWLDELRFKYSHYREAT
jgi:hypothetical protein